MLKIKIHPIFFLYLIVLVLDNKFVYVFSTMLAIGIHEWAHYKTAYNYGYILDKLSLMPYGAMIGGNTTFNEREGVRIAFAGPIANLSTCIILLACWWVFPATYSYTKTIFNSSIALGIFNLLPFFPLDGSKILLSIFNYSTKVLNTLKGLGIVFSCLTGIAFLISFFYSANLNLGITSAILYVSAMTDSEKGCYKNICDNCHFIKNLSLPVEKRTLMIHYDLCIIRLLKHLSPDTETTFEIVDDSFKTIKIISEDELRKIAIKANLHTPIKEFLYP